jgi:large subunit ribosomal protein L17
MNLANSLIKAERIETTLPKAKELKPYVEKMVTLAKKGDLNSRRLAISTLRDDEVVSKLFSALAERFKDRNGGYTRIMKYGFRTGDSAPMALIEFVE